MNKLKIVLASSFFYPRYGGVEYHVEGLAKTLKRLGHEVIVITNSGSTGVEVYKGIPVIRISFRSFGLLPASKLLLNKFRRIYQNLSPDIIHAHHAFSFLGLYSGKLAKELSIPSVLTNHSLPPFYEGLEPFWKVIANGLSLHEPFKYIQYYDSVLSVSKISAKFIAHFYRGKVLVIPNAIDISEFNIEAKRDELGIPEDVPVILTVGRASPKKGFERALAAFHYVIKHIPNARLYVVGPSGRYLSWLKKLAQILRIEENVYFLGFVPRETLIKMYKIADVFLHAAYGGESFGIVLLEAMAAGKPIVATAGDGLKEILEKSNSGFCIESGNPMDISKAVIKLIKDPELRLRLGRNGKRFVEQFSWDKVAERILTVYKSLIE